MSGFNWGFLSGFIAFPMVVLFVVLFARIYADKRERKRIQALWIESVRCTDKGIELLSKDKKVVDVISRESLYTFESGVEYTAIGDALKMTFLLKGNKDYSRGPYFVKLSTDSELRGYLQQA